MTNECAIQQGILEHTSSLRRYASVLTRTQDEADDLVQDCLERALSRSHLYRPDTNLRAWLFTILRNIAITQMRKAKLRQSYASEQLATGAKATAPEQFTCVALKESLRLLADLPAAERQAVALRSVFDMSYEEAADHTGLAVGTIKSRLSRGRARLRTMADPAAAAA